MISRRFLLYRLSMISRRFLLYRLSMISSRFLLYRLSMMRRCKKSVRVLGTLALLSLLMRTMIRPWLTSETFISSSSITQSIMSCNSSSCYNNISTNTAGPTTIRSNTVSSFPVNISSPSSNSSNYLTNNETVNITEILNYNAALCSKYRKEIPDKILSSIQ